MEQKICDICLKPTTGSIIDYSLNAVCRCKKIAEAERKRIVKQEEERDKAVLIYTIGIPSCGKTTFAQAFVDRNPNYVLINKNMIKLMLHNRKLADTNKILDLVEQMETNLILFALASGFNVISDDGNLNIQNEETIKLVADKNLNINLEIIKKDFNEVPLTACLNRDKIRVSSIGEKELTRLYVKYVLKNE